MALWTRLMVSDKGAIGVVTIQRADPESGAGPGGTFTYGYDVVLDDGKKLYRGRVEHAYDDGAVTLLRKVLEDAERQMS